MGNCGSTQKESPKVIRKEINKVTAKDDKLVLGNVPERTAISKHEIQATNFREPINKIQTESKINTNINTNVFQSVDYISNNDVKLQICSRQNNFQTNANQISLNHQPIHNQNNLHNNINPESFSSQPNNMELNEFINYENDMCHYCFDNNGNMNYSVENEYINNNVNNNNNPNPTLNINNNNNNIELYENHHISESESEVNPFERNPFLHPQLDISINSGALMDDPELLLFMSPFNPFDLYGKAKKAEFIFNWECLEKEEGLYFWKLKGKQEIKGI